MRITISMILDYMKDYEFNYGFNSVYSKNDIFNATILDNNLSEYRLDTIYIAHHDFFLNNNNDIFPKNLVCIMNCNLENQSMFKNSNYILIKGKYTSLEIFDKIQSIISFYFTKDNHLMEIIRKNRGLKYLANEIYSFIGNPISIVDTNLKVLAYTDYKLTKDDKWRNLQNYCIHNGYLTNGEDQFDDIKKFVEQMNQNNTPICFENKENNTLKPSICMNILVNNKRIGIIGIFEIDTKFSHGTYDIIVYLSEIFSIELQKNQMNIQFNNDENGYFLYDLLKGKDIPNIKINEIKNQLYFRGDKEAFFILIIEQDSVINSYELAFLKTRIVIDIEKCVSIIYNNNIVVLLSATINSEDILSKNSMEKIKNILTISKSVMGMSRGFTDLTQIKSKYNEAYMAMNVGKKVYKDQFVFKYENIQFFHLIKVCTQVDDQKALCHPAIFKLIDYDKSKSTDFTKTLYSYLSKGRSQINTAKEMNLHRSSLQYRLNKIEAIMGIRLDDYLSLLHIQISIEILKFISYL